VFFLEGPLVLYEEGPLSFGGELDGFCVSQSFTTASCVCVYAISDIVSNFYARKYAKSYIWGMRLFGHNDIMGYASEIIIKVVKLKYVGGGGLVDPASSHIPVSKTKPCREIHDIKST
jgi:hypothetical protein